MTEAEIQAARAELEEMDSTERDAAIAEYIGQLENILETVRRMSVAQWMPREIFEPLTMAAENIKQSIEILEG